MTMNRRHLCLAALSTALPALGTERYPSRPVTILVPQAPGGSNDALARLIAQRLSERLGQAFIVDNRAGAGGNIGTALAAKAPPDGYTLLMTISSTQTINPSLYKSTGFDPIKDFDPIAAVAVVPNVLVVHPGFPARDIKEFVAAVKRHRPPYQYASSGNGTLPHLLAEMLNRAAGLDMGHVPYKGVGPALLDVLSGQISVAFASLPSCIGHLRAGKLRALGVSSLKRSAALPDVPPISETLAGFNGALWVGLFGIARTPADVINRLAAEVAAITSEPAVIERFTSLGAETLKAGPQQLAEMVRTDLARWAPLVKASGARVD